MQRSLNSSFSLRLQNAQTQSPPPAYASDDDDLPPRRLASTISPVRDDVLYEHRRRSGTDRHGDRRGDYKHVAYRRPPRSVSFAADREEWRPESRYVSDDAQHFPFTRQYFAPPLPVFRAARTTRAPAAHAA